jgi:hypothetical protein
MPRTKEQIDSDYSKLCAEVGHRFKVMATNKISFEQAQTGLNKEIQERFVLIAKLEEEASLLSVKPEVIKPKV